MVDSESLLANVDWEPKAVVIAPKLRLSSVTQSPISTNEN